MSLPQMEYCVISRRIADALKNRSILSRKIASPKCRGKPQIVKDTRLELDSSACWHTPLRRIRKFLPQRKFWIFNTRIPPPFRRARVRRTWVHREQFHFSYFLLPYVLFVDSVCRCSLRGRKNSRERERGWSHGIFYWRCVWHSTRTHPIPPPSSWSRGDSSRGSTNSPTRDVEEEPRRVDVFDESIRGHFRYANSLSADKCYAWCTFRPMDYFFEN